MSLTDTKMNSSTTALNSRKSRRQRTMDSQCFSSPPVSVWCRNMSRLLSSGSLWRSGSLFLSLSTGWQKADDRWQVQYNAPDHKPAAILIFCTGKWNINNLSSVSVERCLCKTAPFVIIRWDVWRLSSESGWQLNYIWADLVLLGNFSPCAFNHICIICVQSDNVIILEWMKVFTVIKSKPF